MHDYDESFGFPGDGFKDEDDANPSEVREPAVDGGDAQMNEEAAGSGQSTQETPDTCSCSSR